MAEHGGYRQPANPAPVSGPGAYSRRTDGGPAQRPDGGPRQMDVAGGPYGSTQEFRDQQSAAPMSPLSPPQPQPAPSFTGFGAPTENPDQPVTAGADAGAGPSMADIGIAPAATPDAELRQRLGPMLQVLITMEASPTTTDAFKAQVRELIARIT